MCNMWCKSDMYFTVALFPITITFLFVQWITITWADNHYYHIVLSYESWYADMHTATALCHILLGFPGLQALWFLSPILILCHLPQVSSHSSISVASHIFWYYSLISSSSLSLQLAPCSRLRHCLHDCLHVSNI